MMFSDDVLDAKVYFFFKRTNYLAIFPLQDTHYLELRLEAKSLGRPPPIVFSTIVL